MTAEATRALTHLTARAQIPAPLLSDVLADLKDVGPRLGTTLDQLGHAVMASLDQYDVDEGDGSAPQHNASTARAYLADAAQHARALGGLLDAAQNTIARQYTDSDIDTNENGC